MIAAIWVAGIDGRPSPGGANRSAYPASGEQLRAVCGQEREHAALGDQLPGQRLRIGKLPVHPLETLHETIMLIEH